MLKFQESLILLNLGPKWEQSIKLRGQKNLTAYLLLTSPPQESGFSCLWNENIQLQPRYCYNLLSNEVFNYFSICSIALQIRASQQSITANLWPLTTHFCHVMVIVTGGFSKKPFYHYYFYFVEILLNNLELVFLELLNIQKSFLWHA